MDNFKKINDINNILIEKVSNTERLAGITIKTLKIISVVLIVMFIVCILEFILLNFSSLNKKDNDIVGKFELECTINDETYLYEFEYNKNFEIINAGGDSYIANHTNIEQYSDANVARAHVEDWFKEHNGSCIISES